MSNHGTHVAGILAAGGCGDRHVAGIAPAVTVLSLRVIRQHGERADHDDVASAVEHLVAEHEVHLINISLGTRKDATVLRDAILDAADLGVLTIAAAGNSAKAIEYPAAYDEVVAVGALGKQDEGSEFARQGGLVPRGYKSDGDFYPAGFSSLGPEMTCIAPGVEIVSVVPESSPGTCAWLPMNGTSMASPMACGVLAIILAADSAYLQMEPSLERTFHARDVLERSCVPLGFGADREGRGLPRLPGPAAQGASESSG